MILLEAKDANCAKHNWNAWHANARGSEGMPPGKFKNRCSEIESEGFKSQNIVQWHYYRIRVKITVKSRVYNHHYGMENMAYGRRASHHI